MNDVQNHAKRLYHVFERMFPNLAQYVVKYSAVRHTLRLQTKSHETMIFTYKGNKRWCLKTEEWPD